MKHFLWFLLGLVIGVAGTLGVLYFINNSPQEKNKDYDMSFFDEPGQIMQTREYRVIQAWPNGTGIAMDVTFENVSEMLVPVLLWNKNHEQYYDGQTVKAGKNQVFRQVGICRYTNTDKMMKTVPIVELRSK